MKWDLTIGNGPGDITFQAKKFFSLGSGRCQVRLHKFTNSDRKGCYHTHPAYAIRIVLYGGYIEEMQGGLYRWWKPGDVGLVTPNYAHRIEELLNGKVSYSLWLRGPIKKDVICVGPGWASVPPLDRIQE